MQGYLDTYLRLMAGTAFRWGESDCAQFVARWVHFASGLDLSNGMKARDADAADAITGGDLVGFSRARAKSAGLPETDDPMPGDIGVVMVLDKKCCAIRTRNRWAVKTKRGVLVGDFKMLAAFSVPVTNYG